MLFFKTNLNFQKLKIYKKKNLNVKVNHLICLIPSLKCIELNLLAFYSYYTNYKLNKAIVSNLLNCNFYLRHLFLVNFKDKQARINLIDLKNKKNFTYSTGLVLTVLDKYKKQYRRSLPMLKYVFSYVLKKHDVSERYNNGLLVQGLKKNILRLMQMLCKFIKVFNVSLSLITFNFLKTWQITKCKRVRSIKRRIYKKLVKVNNI